MNRIKIAALAALLLLGRFSAAAEFHAEPSEATLKDDHRVYTRVAVEKDWHPTQRFGDCRYRLDANTVIELATSGKSEQRKASVPPAYRLQWLGAAEGIAFLVANRDEARLDRNDPKSDRRFYRLDLGSMKWLDPFKSPEPSIKPTEEQKKQQAELLVHRAERKAQTQVLADRLLVTPKGVVVLWAEIIVYRDASPSEFLQHQLLGCHVTCYATKDTEPQWDRIVCDDGQSCRSAGCAISPYDDSIERLNYVSWPHGDDLVLVCTGQRSAVVCLDAADGKVRWRLPAIWEYERGSVAGDFDFRCYIERFGLDDWTVYSANGPVLPDNGEIDRKELREQIQSTIRASGKLAAARKAFHALYEGRITAGPIVAPPADESGNPRVYVAAARSLKPEPGGVEQPEHALIYEIKPRGDTPIITGMTRLPREVIGRPYRQVPGGIVLSCNRGSMVRLRIFERDFGGMESTADELTLQVDWYRDYMMPNADSWLVVEPRSDVAGFSKVRLFRLSRAYIRKREDKVYQLPINVVDMRTGLDRNLTLSVPFKGDIPFPERGFSHFRGGAPYLNQWYIFNPYRVWIDHLSVVGGHLQVVVAHDSSRTGLNFDISAMLADE